MRCYGTKILKILGSLEATSAILIRLLSLTFPVTIAFTFCHSYVKRTIMIGITWFPNWPFTRTVTMTISLTKKCQ